MEAGGVFGSGLLPIVAFVVVFQLRNGVFVALLGAQALQFAACADYALRAEGECLLSFLLGMLGCRERPAHLAVVL